MDKKEQDLLLRLMASMLSENSSYTVSEFELYACFMTFPHIQAKISDAILNIVNICCSEELNSLWRNITNIYHLVTIVILNYFVYGIIYFILK